MARDAALWAVGERGAILPFCALGARLAEAAGAAEAEAALRGLAEGGAGGAVLLDRRLAAACGPALEALRGSGRWLVLAVPLVPGAPEAPEDDLRALVTRALGFDLLGQEGG